MMRPSLCVILLLLLQTPLPVTTTDCTPEGFPNYDCQSSSSRSDCVAAHGYSSSNSISEPVLLRYYVFKNNANKYGFYMEWKSPSKDAKSVVGYVIWINRLYLTRLRFELCRYYQIQYTASNNSVVENPVYSLTIDSLEHSNSVYRVEIIALLNSSSSRGGKTSEIFQTYLDLTASTTTVETITTYNKTGNSSAVLTHPMRPTEQAPVTPCPSQQCYANGMCTDCWPHSPIPVGNGWVIGAAVGAVVIMAAVFLAVLLSLRYPNAVKRCFSLRNKRKSYYNMVASDSRRRVCLAYISEELYQHLNDTLCQVLHDFFNCDIILYSTAVDQNMLMSCECILVIYSWNLLENLRYFEGLPSSSAQHGMLERPALLDLLTEPKATGFPPTIVVAFDHVPVENVDYILNRNKDLSLIRIPSETRQLVTSLHLSKYDGLGQDKEEPPIVLHSWSKYEQSGLKETLNWAIDQVKEYNSGFDTVTLTTITTNPSHMTAMDGGKKLGQGQITNRSHDQKCIQTNASHNGKICGTASTVPKDSDLPSQEICSPRTRTIDTVTPFSNDQLYFNSRNFNSHASGADNSQIVAKHMSCSDRLQNHNLQNSGHQPVTSTSQGVDAFSDCVSVDTNINEAELGKAELGGAELGRAESGEFSGSFQCSTVTSSRFQSLLESSSSIYHF